MTTENELNRRNAERHGASDKTLPRLTERGFLTKASERRHDFLSAEQGFEWGNCGLCHEPLPHRSCASAS